MCPPARGRRQQCAPKLAALMVVAWACCNVCWDHITPVLRGNYCYITGKTLRVFVKVLE